MMPSTCKDGSGKAIYALGAARLCAEGQARRVLAHLLVDVVSHDVGEVVVQRVVVLPNGFLPAGDVDRPTLERLPEHGSRAHVEVLALVPHPVGQHVPFKPETQQGESST